MKDIKCPSCGKTFRIDPSSFQEIHYFIIIQDDNGIDTIINSYYVINIKYFYRLEIFDKSVTIMLITLFKWKIQLKG